MIQPMHVASVICQSCETVYEAVGDPADVQGLSCRFCHGLLDDFLMSDRFVAPEWEPAPGRPVLTVVWRFRP